MNDKIQKPYCGNLPYIFISYSHKDMDEAMDE